ncbi:MAG: PilZ domain-containing protein, partial [Rhodoferax sp.]
PFDAPVQLEVQGRRFAVRLIDIALKGALVATETAQALQLQDTCSLVLPLDAQGDAITMNGCIAHLEDLHIGIKCVDIEISSMIRLRRLIELNTGNADAVDRELSLLFTSR